MITKDFLKTGKSCEKIRACWYFKNHVHWWLTCQGCPNNINCFCALTSMVLPWTVQTSCNILTETQSKHIWGRTRGGTQNGRMEEKSRRVKTQTKFRVSWTNTWPRQFAHGASIIQPLTTAYHSDTIYYYKILTTQVWACDYMWTGKSRIILGQTWDHETCAFYCPLLKKAAVCKSTTCPATVTVKWQCQKCGVQVMQQY